MQTIQCIAYRVHLLLHIQPRSLHDEKHICKLTQQQQHLTSEPTSRSVEYIFQLDGIQRKYDMEINNSFYRKNKLM